MHKDTRLEEALAKFIRAFAAGDGETFVGHFAEDAKALLHEEPALVGATEIRNMFIRLFAMVDTAGFEVEYDTIDVQAERAYVLASFRETLRPKDRTSAIRVDGRLVCFWRRAEDGSWQVTRLLTGRAGPDRIGF